jgi:phage terminase large subunit
MLKLRGELPEWSQVLFRPARYKVIYGGRGAARSWSFARALLIMGSQTKLRILCCREFQKSIADSVHKLLQDQILLLGLPGWKISKTTIEHVGTGSTFIFEGLRYNTNRVKSLEGIDICWVEEAESVAKDSWEILIPTIRKPGSQIWISFNPDLEEDPTYQRFVINQPPNAIVLKVGWEHNPWFGEELQAERDYLYRVDPEAAEHVWGGHPRKASAAQILSGKWRVEAFEPEPTWIGPMYGLDYGFAEDPLALNEIYIKPNKAALKSQGSLMIRKELWRLKLDLHHMNREFVKTFGTNLVRRAIRADSSRPESTSYLRQHGFPRIVSAMKWPGSLEDGIAYLRGFEEIIIHPDCPKTREEARLWSYKVDKDTQEVLPEVVDKHNHTWDDIRYALSPMIRASRKRTSSYSGTSYANG